MIDKKTITPIVLRLKALKHDSQSAPEDRVIRFAEVATALQTGAKSPQHAQEVVQHLLETREWFPSPADIYAALRELAPIPVADTSTEYGCDRCGWNGGWLVTERGGVSGVQECECRKSGTCGERRKRLTPGLTHRPDDLAGKLRFGGAR